MQDVQRRLVGRIGKDGPPKLVANFRPMNWSAIFRIDPQVVRCFTYDDSIICTWDLSTLRIFWCNIICSHRKRASLCTTRADHAFKSCVSWDFIRLLYTPLLAGACRTKAIVAKHVGAAGFSDMHVTSCFSTGAAPDFFWSVVKSR